MNADWIAFCITVFGLGVLVVAGLLIPAFRARERRRLYEFLRQSNDLGHPIPTELLAQIADGPIQTPDKDIRRGAVLLALAVGIAIPLVSVGRGDADVLAMGVTLISIFACLGVAFLALGLLRRPAKS
ncbi:MAG: hypothetical protein BGN86_03225 [Caulobacterales bacterium 68-7]|nr:hypothetical protein [Caulobacterales bacterium]OJU08877.1 MAG: hypothetical protein BGN86_03225 [Caulobacterales bacterium 68-7]